MPRSTSTHYTVLGVAANATQAQIKRAYRDLAKAHHPDVSKSPAAAKTFARIAAAYEVLSDSSKRKTYDQSLLNPKPSRRTPEVDLRPHYTWTNIAAHGAAEAEKANREAEIDELYDTFFAPAKKPSPAAGGVGKAKARRRAG